MEDKIVNFIEELENKCNEEYKLIKSDAYNVSLESNYAIELRDKFNKNGGKFEIIRELKSGIFNLLNDISGGKHYEENN